MHLLSSVMFSFIVTVPSCSHDRHRLRHLTPPYDPALSTLVAQGALREDLRILVMSATLDGTSVAHLLGDVPVIASEGRAYPVETRHLERDPNRRIEDAMADAILRALRADPGSVLAFLPG